MISQTVEYTLRAVVTLAHNGTNASTAQQLAARTRVPSAYLAKLMQRLVRAGLVRSRRGLHGGFVLTKTPQEVTILDIVDAVEPLQRIRECPLGIGSHDRSLCPLHRRLDEAMASVEEGLRRTTLSELLAESDGQQPLCSRVPSNLVGCRLP